MIDFELDEEDLALAQELLEREQAGVAVEA